MPSSSKAKGAPQPSMQKSLSSTTALKAGDDRLGSNPKAATKPLPPIENLKAKAGSGGNTSDSLKPTTSSNQTANNPPSNATPAGASAGVNRKKQKRREKQAARMAAGQEHNDGYVSGASGGQNGHLTSVNGTSRLDMIDPTLTVGGFPDPDFDDPDQYGEGEDLYYTDDEGRLIPAANGASAQYAYGDQSKKSKKKKKSKIGSSAQDSMQTNHLEGSSTSLSTPPPSIRPPLPPPPPLSNAALRATHKISRDRIWNTSTAEERERIKEFWLSLGEEERRSLVKVEKEAVLRKMKEQQKHSCSCTVCGRKRTAIEEELEVLYDAYYDELEQYAHHNRGVGEGPPVMPPPRLYNNHQPKSASDRMTHLPNKQLPSRGKVTDASEDEDAEDDEYDDEDDEVDYSEDDLVEEITSAIPSSSDAFDYEFPLGASLTVKEGILTVADDLLKNDGRKFIDMMEQLAEKRLQREEETQYAASALAHQSMHHNHGPPPEDDDDDEYDDDEEYVSDEEDYEDEDDMDEMTEEQRMREGRRMFQIFAARMFEQRVLTAYREKVARERQQKLIEELEEDSRLEAQKEAKKAREAQKKKDKKKQQKQAKEEEKSKREVEKAAEEARLKAIEEKKQDEQKQRREEQRKKKEAEKKAQDEERVKKETEKQKRLQEERDRQAEAERKQKEQKEREKKKRDDEKRKEREEREAKDKGARERRADEERERKAREEQVQKDKEDKARKDREVAAKAEKEARERVKREELHAAAHQVSQATAGQKRGAQPGPVHLPPGLHPPQGPSNLQSPHFQVATPVVPKAPTPVRQRQSSQQGSHASSPRSQQAITESSHSASPGNAPFSQGSIPPTPASAKSQSSLPPLVHPQPSAPMSPIRGPSGRNASSGFAFDSMMGMSSALPPTTSAPMMPPGMSYRAPMGPDLSGYQNQPPIGGQFRTHPPNGIGIPMPPGMNGNRVMQQGRGFPLDSSANYPMHTQSSIPSAAATSRDPMRSQPHSRQQSASYDKPVLDNINTAPTQPIGRPAPIKRPSSPRRSRENSRQLQSDLDNVTAQLGSSALLDDTDTFTSSMTENMHASGPPGAPGSGRSVFGPSPLFPDPIGSSKLDNHNIGSHGGLGSTWNSQLPFGTPGLTGAPTWGNTPGWTASNNAFGIIGGPNRPHASRPVTIRLMVRQACEELTKERPSLNNGFHHATDILNRVNNSIKPHNEQAVLDSELMDIIDTEGNMQNGGGSFLAKTDTPRTGDTWVKFEPERDMFPSGRGGMAPGDIGSPIPSNSFPAFGRQPFQSSPPTGF